MGRTLPFSFGRRVIRDPVIYGPKPIAIQFSQAGFDRSTESDPFHTSISISAGDYNIGLFEQRQADARSPLHGVDLDSRRGRGRASVGALAWTDPILSRTVLPTPEPALPTPSSRRQEEPERATGRRPPRR
jgi:hypothetical protein